MGYAGGHKYFSYASLVLSAISSAFALVPFYHIWRIIKEVLSLMPDFGNAAGIVKKRRAGCCFFNAFNAYLCCGAYVLT